MFETENFVSTSIRDAEIIVSAYREQLDSDDMSQKLWGFCLRIENNSSQRIRLLRKNLCITDDAGRNFHDSSYGFHGELPDLEPGECFEFEDTAITGSRDALLYGNCVACTEDGDEFKIKLPLIPLLSAQSKTASGQFLN